MPIDLDLYFSHTRGRGIVEVFLRGHLWIEKFLIELLEAEIPHPAPLKLDRMAFAHKVNLGEALRLLSPADANSLRVVNGVRNRLAHDLEGEPTTEDVKRLEGALTSSQSNLARKLVKSRAHGGEDLPDDPDEVVRLSCAVLALITEMEMHRQQHVYWRTYRDKLEPQRLAAAIIEHVGGRPIPEEEFRRAEGIPDPPTGRDVVLKKEPNVSESDKT